METAQNPETLTLIGPSDSPEFLMAWIDHVVTAGTAAVRECSPVLEMEWKANLRATPNAFCAWLNERLPIQYGWDCVPLDQFPAKVRSVLA